ncbi:hypothetical protein T439DRAFT_118388 [Meredithblackwellia eburnea MCA 4105]
MASSASDSHSRSSSESPDNDNNLSNDILAQQRLKQLEHLLQIQLGYAAEEQTSGKHKLEEDTDEQQRPQKKQKKKDHIKKKEVPAPSVASVVLEPAEQEEVVFRLFSNQKVPTKVVLHSRGADEHAQVKDPRIRFTQGNSKAKTTRNRLHRCGWQTHSAKRISRATLKIRTPGYYP